MLKRFLYFKLKNKLQYVQTPHGNVMTTYVYFGAKIFESKYNRK